MKWPPRGEVSIESASFPSPCAAARPLLGDFLSSSLPIKVWCPPGVQSNSKDFHLFSSYGIFPSSLSFQPVQVPYLAFFAIDYRLSWKVIVHFFFFRSLLPIGDLPSLQFFFVIANNDV